MSRRIPRKLSLNFYRWVDDEYYRWTNKRHTGLKVSWHYTPPQEVQPDTSFTEDNKHFVRLANVIQLQGGREGDMEGLVDDITREKMKGESCNVGEVSKTAEILISGISQNISMEAISKEEITKETLERAAAIYFRIVFCPDYDPEIVKFYQDLFENFSLETVLRTLARILYVAREKRLAEHYNTAWTLFDKTTTLMELQHRDIALLTTGAAELEHFADLKSHQLNKQIIDSKEYITVMHNQGSFIGSPNVEELINHPAHISDRNTISAFIPFCSFGFNVDLIGEKLSNFQVPVCSLFRKKIFSGQVCYEADLNQFKNKIDWKRALKKGFSFIIDTNDEYDVKNLFQRKSPRSLENNLELEIFQETEDDHNFVVILKTISEK